METGKKVFVKNCAQAQKYPNLICLFSRQNSQPPGHAYTGANNNQNSAWANNHLDTYRTNPTKYIPGQKFVFAGLLVADHFKKKY